MAAEMPKKTRVSYNMILHTAQQKVELSSYFKFTEDMPDLADSKVHGANMGPIWSQQDPGGPHVGHMNLAV